MHAASAQDKLARLRTSTSHSNKKISLIMAPRVIETANSYEQERTKFDQLRPILAPASSTIPSSSPLTPLALEDNDLYSLSSDIPLLCEISLPLQRYPYQPYLYLYIRMLNL